MVILHVLRAEHAAHIKAFTNTKRSKQEQHGCLDENKFDNTSICQQFPQKATAVQ